MMKSLIILLNMVLFSSLASAEPIYDPSVQAFINHSKSDSSTPTPVELSASVVNTTLYASEVTEDVLLSVDYSNATATSVCSLHSPVVAGLAYDPKNNILYGTDTVTLNLLQIDPSLGVATIIGHMGIQLPHGVAIDPADGTLYVAASSSESRYSSFLYTVDIFTAEVTLVGPIGYSNINALDFNPLTGVLYGAYAGPSDNGFLISIDTSTGQGTFISHTHRITGMSFDDQGQLYAADNGAIEDTPSMLYRINVTDGSWTQIGSIEVDNVLGLVFWSIGTSVESKSWGKIKTGYSPRQ